MAEGSATAATVTVAGLCAIIPDAGGIGYFLGIPYGAIFGHRGCLHSLLFALLLSATVTLIFFRDTPVLHFIVFFAATASAASSTL